MPDPHLVLIALRSDDPRLVEHLGRVLADTGAIRPDSSPSVFAKPVGDLLPDDLTRLAGFIGSDGVEDLNIGRAATATVIGD